MATKGRGGRGAWGVPRLFSIMMLAIALLLGLAQFHRSAAVDSLTVETTSGSVQGFTDDLTPNVAQYLGIPFAEPPVGARRWLPPAPKCRENQTIKATALRPACPQAQGNTSNVWRTDAPEFLTQPPEYQSEDCLNLNVWAPLEQCTDESEKKLLPVLIWIYGGGYTSGGANVPYQIPARWVERTGEHIVVAISYRVNIFGFPNAKSLADDEQNLGFLDQRLAVEWVRDNIRNFGGDPNRMILWGQSAGASSVDGYNFAYPEDPIVSGLIMNSGTTFIGINSEDVQQTNFTFVAHHFGCNSPSAQAEIDCLRGVDSVSITQYLKQYSDRNTQPSFSFLPVIDNRTLYSNYTARALAGKFSRKPAIIGNTNDEGTAFQPYNRTYGVNTTLADADTATIFHCPAVKTTYDRYAANATTFRYLYAGNFSNISPQPWEGAYHSSDIPLYFGTYGIVRGNGTAFEKAVSEKVQDYYLAFAKDPVNGLPQMGWNAYTPSGEAVLIGYDGEIVQGIEESELEKPCDGVKPNGLPIPP
ncbi:PnbA Carboxylesterase type B [Pyrenophora tritici-repentis]|nr:PnbA Carboxylesterase type B [Pyrenophora tritici-repentis]KAI1528156.1 PnbA Carboxylesterase type B [Pyrenophora tritici-repentis]KAI1536001.1 PnbA Carboxylesterase type B [Pyrenophora tritici-repentis]KAI1596400.1 PnbA Carboxylesterase type B [Pyrenophora tritici-repentis]